MSNKQARLIAAIADAMQAQGFNQKRIATACGTPQSMISAALSGKYDLKEERWRMMCEALALDYDDIIADPDEVRAETVEDPAAKVQMASDNCKSAEAEEQKEEAVPVEDQQVMLGDDEAEVIGVVTRYIEKHLRIEISQGTDMSLDEIYTLMEFCKSREEIIG